MKLYQSRVFQAVILLGLLLVGFLVIAHVRGYSIGSASVSKERGAYVRIWYHK